jgi:hypothetical protein
MDDVPPYGTFDCSYFPPTRLAKMFMRPFDQHANIGFNYPSSHVPSKTKQHIKGWSNPDLHRKPLTSNIP